MEKSHTKIAGAIAPALIAVVLFLPFFLPSLASAAIVPCGGANQSACNFNFLIELIKNVVDFLLFAFAVPLAAVSFAIAGFMTLTAGDNAGQVAKAKEIFWNVFIGLIIAFSAWLIVKAITAALQSSAVESYL